MYCIFSKPMFRSRPLFPTKADHTLFQWAAPAREFADAVKQGLNALLVADHGGGKTSALHAVEYELRRLRRPVAFLSLANAAGIEEAIALVRRAADDQGWVPDITPDERARLLDPAEPFAPTAAVRGLRPAPEGAVLILDDVGTEIGLALFGRLRDELWQLPLRWGVAVQSQDAGALLTPPADAFFDRVVQLQGLSPADREEFLTLRNPKTKPRLTQKEIQALTRSGPSNARDLVTAARKASTGEVPAGEFRDTTDALRSAAEAAAGRPGAMLITELTHLGPVSASDSELLRQLGWTRPRATQVLNRLEQAGLVHSFPEPRDGHAGRPRKLYEIAPSEKIAQ